MVLILDSGAESLADGGVAEASQVRRAERSPEMAALPRYRSKYSVLDSLQGHAQLCCRWRTQEPPLGVYYF